MANSPLKFRFHPQGAQGQLNDLLVKTWQKGFVQTNQHPSLQTFLHLWDEDGVKLWVDMAKTKKLKFSVLFCYLKLNAISLPALYITLYQFQETQLQMYKSEKAFAQVINGNRQSANLLFTQNGQIHSFLPFSQPRGRPVLSGSPGLRSRSPPARWAWSACTPSSWGLTACPWSQRQYSTAAASSGTAPAAPPPARLDRQKQTRGKEKDDDKG